MRHLKQLLFPGRLSGRCKHGFALLSLGLLLLAASTQAATYYVDFVGGADSNSGTATNAAWQHCPGDPNATGTASVTTPAPGDTLLFRGGVTYRGAIRCDFVGTAAQPIVLRGDGWGSPNALLSGAELLTTPWTQCTNAADCHGNTNYANVWWTTPAPNMDYWTLLYSGTNQFFNSQQPNPSDFVIWQQTSEMRTVASANFTANQVTDPAFLTQSDSNFYSGSLICAWVCGNEFEIKPITGYNPATGTISFNLTTPGGLNSLNNQRFYKIMNHPAFLDVAGETALQTNENRLYLCWPTTPVNVEISRRAGVLIVVNGRNLVFQGFTIQGASYGQSGYGGGSGFASIPDGYGLVTNLTLCNNEFRFCRGPESLTATVSFGMSDNLTLSNLVIHDCLNRGIVSSGTNSIFTANSIYHLPGAGMYISGFGHQVTYNRLHHIIGIHSNGLAAYNDTSATIAFNQFILGYRPFSFSASTNLLIYNNIFDCTPYGGVVNDWGSSAGVIQFYNNVMIGDPGNASVQVGNGPTFYFYNNIIGGGNIGGNIRTNAVEGWNLWTGLCWAQDPRTGYTFGPGDVVQRNLSAVFVNAGANDYRLAVGSPAIGAGTNLSALAISNDLAGNPRPAIGPWDIGAYEVSKGVNPTGLIGPPTRLRVAGP